MAVAAYDAIADWYDKSVRQGTLLSGDYLIADAIFASIGSMEGQRICDLACGQGDMARQLAKRGANVVGIDLSVKLLEIAVRDEEAKPLGIEYTQDDAQTLWSIEDARFDGVLCNLALMDIPDIEGTANAVHRILKPNGWFIASITHPCFQIPPNHDYQHEGFWLSENPNGVRGKVGAHHRTLSTYLNAFGTAGLLLERMTEPKLPGRTLPPVLVAQCRKVDATGSV